VRGSMIVLTLALALGLAMATPSGVLSIVKTSGGEPAGVGSFDAETLHYDGDNYNAIGLTSGGVFRVAARFTPAAICTLTSVVHFHNDPELSDQYIVVYGPGTTTTPGAAIDSAQYPASTTDWCEVTWPALLELPAGTDFWVSIWHNHSAGLFPAGLDAGPMVRDRGGFIQSDVIGPDWQQIGDLGYDGNWNIRAVINGGGSGVEELQPVVGSRLEVTPTVVRDFACVSYSLSRGARVELGVYDVSGEQVRTLAAGTVAAGDHSVTWNRTDDSGRTVANGTYFYRLVVEGRTVTSKAVVLN